MAKHKLLKRLLALNILFLSPPWPAAAVRRARCRGLQCRRLGRMGRRLFDSPMRSQPRSAAFGRSPIGLSTSICSPAVMTPIRYRPAADAGNHDRGACQLGLPPPILPPLPRDPFDQQLEAVLEERPPVFSFTFGIRPPAQLDALKKRGVTIAGTATTVEEARRLEQASVDAIVAQGAEAGAHRGSFAAPFEDSIPPLATLLRGVCAQRCITSDCLWRHHGRARYCRRDETWRRCGAARDRLSAVSGIGRATGLQAGAA